MTVDTDKEIVNKIQNLEGIDDLINDEILLKFIDFDQGIVTSNVIYIVESNYNEIKPEILIKIIKKLKDENYIKRIILVLGNSLKISQASFLERYLNRDSLKLTTIAALAKIGIKKYQLKFSKFLIPHNENQNYLIELLNLVKYINQPWLVLNLHVLLDNKLEIKYLGDNLPSKFPNTLRVCDEIVPIIAIILNKDFPFSTGSHKNYSNEDIQEVKNIILDYFNL
jgi:hypothetical protein